MPHRYSTLTSRFASITINLGPTFLSGTMAANINHKPREPSCPLVQGPFRHYIINFLWIFVNIICIGLTIYHLVKLYRDYTHPSADTVRVATLVTSIVSGDSNASEVSREWENNLSETEITAELPNVSTSISIIVNLSSLVCY